VDNSDFLPTSIPEDKILRDRVFEQYKLAVEMWDRIRTRRQVSNTFYATINTALVAAISVKHLGGELSISICISRVLLCLLWIFTIGRYIILNAAKRGIIIGIERFFLFRPFSAEMQTRLVMLTKIELVIPFDFIGIYVALLLKLWFPDLLHKL
jgi:hypothetical protein